jgi:hypothetical protein
MEASLRSIIKTWRRVILPCAAWSDSLLRRSLKDAYLRLS